MEQRKIGNYLILHKMQLRLTLKFVFLGLVAAMLTGMVVLLVVWPILAGFVPQGLLQQTQTQLLIKLGCYSIPLLGVMILWGILITHSIAGPIYKIERSVEQLLRGEEINSIHIRRGDECQELVAQINRLIALLTHLKEMLGKK